MFIFRQNPYLKPLPSIGLPLIIFCLEYHWQKESLSSFLDVSDLSHFESFLLRKLRENCIIITYAVFPSVHSDVLEYLKSSAIHQKFQEKGVSVKLPEKLDRNKGYLLRTHNIFIHLYCVYFRCSIIYLSTQQVVILM